MVFKTTDYYILQKADSGIVVDLIQKSNTVSAKAEELKYKGVILFDGVCNFCNSSINFIIRHDAEDYFRYAALQSDIGKKIAGQFNLDTANLQTIILMENGIIYTRTTAALRICRHLNGGWKLMYGFIIVPAVMRDWIYNIIARYRYKWWGKRESCMVPTPEIRKKFL